VASGLFLLDATYSAVNVEDELHKRRWTCDDAAATALLDEMEHQAGGFSQRFLGHGETQGPVLEGFVLLLLEGPGDWIDGRNHSASSSWPPVLAPEPALTMAQYMQPTMTQHIQPTMTQRLTPLRPGSGSAMQAKDTAVKALGCRHGPGCGCTGGAMAAMRGCSHGAGCGCSGNAMLSSPLAKLAVHSIQHANQCSCSDCKRSKRDVSMMAKMAADMDSEDKATLKTVAEAVTIRAREMAGVTAPMGFFDPLGFTTNINEGKLLFYREVELKHGRVCMLAALGILVGEQFHPLFGGDIDVPSYIAFQQTPLQSFGK